MVYTKQSYIVQVETSPVNRGLTGCSYLEVSYVRCAKVLKLERTFLGSKPTPTPPASTFNICFVLDPALALLCRNPQPLEPLWRRGVLDGFGGV